MCEHINLLPAMGGEIKRNRQALLPGCQVAAIESVGLLRGTGTGYRGEKVGENALRAVDKLQGTAFARVHAYWLATRFNTLPVVFLHHTPFCSTLVFLITLNPLIRR